MKIRFLTLAQREVDSAFLWYEEQAVRLGRGFLKDWGRCLAWEFAI